MVPVVTVTAANAGEIRAGAFGTPHEGAVVHGFFGDGIVAVALGLPAEGTDHLRVAAVAAFAYVDVESGKAQRVVGFDVAVFRTQLVVEKQRHDLYETAPDDGKEGEDAEDNDAFFDAFVAHDVHCGFSWSQAGCVCSWAAGCLAPATVFQQLYAIRHMPLRKKAPPRKRTK